MLNLTPQFYRVNLLSKITYWFDVVLHFQRFFNTFVVMLVFNKGLPGMTANQTSTF